MSTQPACIISYVPLLDYSGYTPGTTIEPTSDYVKGIDGHVNIDGCLWSGDPETRSFTPIIVCENAQAIVDHMRLWADGHPEDWFELLVEDNGDNYMVALIPRVDLSVKRWEVAYALMHGYAPDLSNCHIIFKIICFSSATSDVYRFAKRHLSGMLMFMDKNDFSIDSPFDPVDESKLIRLGPFEMANPLIHARIIDQQLEYEPDTPDENRSMINPDFKGFGDIS